MTTQQNTQGASDNLAPVSEYSQIMGLDLTSRARDRQTVWARYAVFKYIREECGLSYEKIAYRHSMNHATVIYGVEQINSLLQLKDQIALRECRKIYTADPEQKRPIQKGRARKWLKYM